MLFWIGARGRQPNTIQTHTHTTICLNWWHRALEMTHHSTLRSNVSQLLTLHQYLKVLYELGARVCVRVDIVPAHRRFFCLCLLAALLPWWRDAGTNWLNFTNWIQYARRHAIKCIRKAQHMKWMWPLKIANRWGMRSDGRTKNHKCPHPSILIYDYQQDNQING